MNLTVGNYIKNQWLDTVTGTLTAVASINQTAQEAVAFTPPNTSTDWVLLVR